MRWVALCCAACAATAVDAGAAEWFVAAGGTGAGTSTAPFGRIQQALNVAQPGDVITVGPGTYVESLQTIRSGTASLPIRLRAQGNRGTTLVTYAGRVMRVSHAYMTVEKLVLDAQYAAADAVTVETAGNFATFRNVEVRRSTRDLIDIRAPQGVLIEDSLIHHALNATGGRTDAHGVVAGSARNLTIRNTEIHTFSGDGFQIDPGRNAPGWDNVTIERSRIWLAPLPAAENGFAAGVVPGENAVDTKVGATLPRARITIRDTTAWGFRNGLIGNMAAFNLKENISATVDRVTVYDSEIAFRLRGGDAAPTGAWVTVKNAVVYNARTAFRYEDDIQNLKIWNSTLGSNVASAFQDADSGMGGLEVRNLLTLAPLPAEAAHSSNRRVAADAFVSVAAHNYALAAGSPAIDAGVALSGVTSDRSGTSRPQGSGYDVGAYEWVPPTGSGPVGSDDGTSVVHVGRRAVLSGAWRVVADQTAASAVRVWHPNSGAYYGIQKYPVHYFDVTVWVEAGKWYRLWIRGKAEENREWNDTVAVQFSGAVDGSGRPRYPFGGDALMLSLRECSACGLSNWGWQDTATGLNVLGPAVRFGATGLQTIRIQTVEDGVSIDQVVLSPSSYLTSAPGAWRDDTTILPES
jgi:hypothetical protein